MDVSLVVLDNEQVHTCAPRRQEKVVVGEWKGMYEPFIIICIFKGLDIFREGVDVCNVK